MKRTPSFRASIVALDALLARYATRPGLLDAIHAMAILDDAASPAPCVPASPAPCAPTLTELALAHIRARSGRARLRASIPLGELFDRRLAAYAPAQTRSREALLRARTFLCRRLGAATPAAAVTRPDIESALAAYRCPVSRNSLLCRLRLLFRWAVRERLLDAAPTDGIAPARVDWREPAFFPPERVERILRVAESHPGPLEAGVGPTLALGFLCGVRTVEIHRARWEDLDLDARTLRIPRPKGFTAGHRPRLVELEPSAVAWLRRWRDWAGSPASGPVSSNPRAFGRWKALRLAPAGLSWGNDAAHNAMRHTYATMHVGAFRDAAATALNLGHARGTDLLDRHYRGLVPRAVAETYWRILPSSSPLPPPEPLPGRGFRSDLAAQGRPFDGLTGKHP